MLGTMWTAPNEGSTIAELLRAFHGFRYEENVVSDSDKTNLRLTGEAITEYDWERLESDAFKVGE